MSVQEAVLEIPHWRVLKAHDSKKKKLQYLVRDSEASRQVTAALIAHGGKPKMGRPVKGYLEKYLSSVVANDEKEKW